MNELKDIVEECFKVNLIDIQIVIVMILKRNICKGDWGNKENIIAGNGSDEMISLDYKLTN